MVTRMELEEKLFYVLEAGDYRTLRYLLHQGIPANTMFYGADPVTKSQWSALHLCCEKGRYECAKVLLEEGAYPDMQDKWNQTPLMYSVCGEWRNLTQLLLTSGAEVNSQDKKGRTAAHVAVNCSDNRCLQLLIDGGINTNLTNNDGATPLRLAVTADGNMDKVTSLLAVGSDVNLCDFRDERSPLQAALGSPTFAFRKSYVRMLLDHKAGTNTVDRLGLTPLMTLMMRYKGRNWERYPMVLAELWQEKDLITWLVEAGHDVNRVTPKHGSALHVAVEISPVFVEHLLTLGADPNVLVPAMSALGRTPRPKTALYLAAKNQDVGTAKALISYNSDLNVNGDVMSPLCAALDNSDRDVAHLLIDAGYDVTADKRARDLLNYDVISVVNRKGESLSEEDWSYFREESNRPLGLLVTCRNFIRELLGTRLREQCKKLPLPAALISDILLEKLTN